MTANEDTKDTTIARPAPLTAESLLEPLLAVHSAPTVAWLADASATAAERGLGALYSLLCLPTGQSGRLRVAKPASGVQVRNLARLSQAIESDVVGIKVDAAGNEYVARAMEQGHVVAVESLRDVLSLRASGVEKGQRALGVSGVWLLPLYWNGSSVGLQIVLMGPGAAVAPVEAELLGRHAAVALANLRELQEGRKSGDVDSVRWIYDERRFREELEQETRRAHRHQRPLSMLTLRILNLDELYRRYGRFLAERVQRQVAAMLDTALRDTDFLGSSAKEGFATILVETDAVGAARAKDRLLDGLQSMKLENTELPSLNLQLACATATLAEDGENAEELLAAVTARMEEQDAVQQDVAAAG